MEKEYQKITLIIILKSQRSDKIYNPPHYGEGYFFLHSHEFF